MVSKLLSLLVLSLTVLSEVFGASCPTGFKLVNQNKCLKIFTNKLKHLAAEQDCTYLGGTLVTVKSEEENRAVSSLAASTAANSIWLGIFCYTTLNGTITCYHDDNSGPLGNYTNFAAGNPTVQGYGGCVFMQVNGASAGQWVSAPCEVIGLQFVCEVPATENDPFCKHNYNGYCYIPSHELSNTVTNLSYSEAQQVCEINGANLVSIHSRPEIDYIRSIYRTSGVPQIYLGALALLPNTFEWVDGSDWDYDNTNPLGMSTDSCLTMDFQFIPDDGLWNPVTCDSVQFFLCKRKIGGGVLGASTMEPMKMEPEIKKSSKINLKNHTELLDFSNCNATIILAPGTITSVGYPNAKPTIAYCTWNLAALGPYRLAVYFTKFSTATNVYIYDQLGYLISSPKGNQPPQKVLSSGNVLKIVHDSSLDAGYGYTGFSATVLPY